MAAPAELSDCKYYIWGSCTRDPCMYRHSPKALLNDTNCEKWAKGDCSDKACENRHAQAMWNSHSSSTTKRPCRYYAEGRCMNGAACPFLHEDGAEKKATASPTPKAAAPDVKTASATNPPAVGSTVPNTTAPAQTELAKKKREEEARARVLASLGKKKPTQTSAPQATTTPAAPTANADQAQQGQNLLRRALGGTAAGQVKPNAQQAPVQKPQQAGQQGKGKLAQQAGAQGQKGGQKQQQQQQQQPQQPQQQQKQKLQPKQQQEQQQQKVAGQGASQPEGRPMTEKQRRILERKREYEEKRKQQQPQQQQVESGAGSTTVAEVAKAATKPVLNRGRAATVPTTANIKPAANLGPAVTRKPDATLAQSQATAPVAPESDVPAAPAPSDRVLTLDEIKAQKAARAPEPEVTAAQAPADRVLTLEEIKAQKAAKAAAAQAATTTTSSVPTRSPSPNQPTVTKPRPVVTKKSAQDAQNAQNATQEAKALGRLVRIRGQTAAATDSKVESKDQPLANTSGESVLPAAISTQSTRAAPFIRRSPVTNTNQATAPTAPVAKSDPSPVQKKPTPAPKASLTAPVPAEQAQSTTDPIPMGLSNAASSAVTGVAAQEQSGLETKQTDVHTTTKKRTAEQASGGVVKKAKLIPHPDSLNDHEFLDALMSAVDGNPNAYADVDISDASNWAFLKSLESCISSTS